MDYQGILTALRSYRLPDEYWIPALLGFASAVALVMLRSFLTSKREYRDRSAEIVKGDLGRLSQLQIDVIIWGFRMLNDDRNSPRYNKARSNARNAAQELMKLSKAHDLTLNFLLPAFGAICSIPIVMERRKLKKSPRLIRRARTRAESLKEAVRSALETLAIKGRAPSNRVKRRVSRRAQKLQTALQALQK